ncbi:MAG: hypothetical protein J6T01_02955 [Kiritimatiellae bacterium]|nr:hypothetical protein [Kiritimatiellia bacterium]
MVEEQNEENEVTLRTDVDEAEIRDTDIVFDCPHCGKNLVIDYRGAGLQINCSECGETVLVPIPDGMELHDLDLDPGEILKQLFATRRNFQKAELEIQGLKARLVQLQEALGVMQEVVAEGLADA